MNGQDYGAFSQQLRYPLRQLMRYVKRAVGRRVWRDYDTGTLPGCRVPDCLRGAMTTTDSKQLRSEYVYGDVLRPELISIYPPDGARDRVDRMWHRHHRADCQCRGQHGAGDISLPAIERAKTRLTSARLISPDGAACPSPKPLARRPDPRRRHRAYSRRLGCAS